MSRVQNGFSSGLKQRVRAFWEAAPCGEIYAQGDSLSAQLASSERARYELEPYLPGFAGFGQGACRDVLEIGVGMGVDHSNWARSGPKSLTGIDLTFPAVCHTRSRLDCLKLSSRLLVADAENLPFPASSFDLVYSWGVLHHSPDTSVAIREVLRVLRPGGLARIMIYHKYSLVGYMLWLRYGLLQWRPRRSLDDIYASHLESPGTKAYEIREARRMFEGFSSVEVRSMLGFGDLLHGEVGQRHRGILLAAAKRLWPRWFIKRFLHHHGLLLLIKGVK